MKIIIPFTLLCAITFFSCRKEKHTDSYSFVYGKWNLDSSASGWGGMTYYDAEQVQSLVFTAQNNYTWEKNSQILSSSNYFVSIDSVPLFGLQQAIIISLDNFYGNTSFVTNTTSNNLTLIQIASDGSTYWFSKN